MCLYLRISLHDHMSTMCSLWFMFEELHLVSSVSIPFVCCGGMGMGMGKYVYGYGYGCGVVWTRNSGTSGCSLIALTTLTT